MGNGRSRWTFTTNPIRDFFVFVRGCHRTIRKGSFHTVESESPIRTCVRLVLGDYELGVNPCKRFYQTQDTIILELGMTNFSDTNLSVLIFGGESLHSRGSPIATKGSCQLLLITDE
jgi:hypothetical protein